MRTDTDNTVVIKISCGLLAYVRDVGSKLFHSPLRITHFSDILIHVYGSKDIPTDHPL